MDLKEILVISGKKGLYKLVSQGKNNIIVEAMENKSRMPVFTSSPVSSLKDICVFTNDEDVALKDVFFKIFQTTSGEKVQESKISNDVELKKYMEEILPEYDKARVHVSDMKKLFSWYNILHENGLMVFDDEEKEPETEPETETDRLTP